MTPDPRGQTTLDFTIGVTIFVLVLTGVFLFVPGTLEPFERGNQEDIVSVNRVADDLVEGSLGEPTTPYVLDDECTVAFFNGANDCGFTGSTLEQRVGLNNFQFVNITIRGNTSGTNDLLCWNGAKAAGNRLESASSCGSGSEVLLAAGDDPLGSQSTVTSRRIVELDGKDVFLVVKVW